MISIQIDEVRCGFESLERLEQNGWQALPDEVDLIYVSSALHICFTSGFN